MLDNSIHVLIKLLYNFWSWNILETNLHILINFKKYWNDWVLFWVIFSFYPLLIFIITSIIYTTTGCFYQKKILVNILKTAYRWREKSSTFVSIKSMHYTCKMFKFWTCIRCNWMMQYVMSWFCCINLN